jgi:hypothetical protein
MEFPRFKVVLGIFDEEDNLIIPAAQGNLSMLEAEYITEKVQHYGVMPCKAGHHFGYEILENFEEKCQAEITKLIAAGNLLCPQASNIHRLLEDRTC